MDIIGDGFPDLAVSAHQDNNGGTNSGAFYLLNFNQNQQVASTTLSFKSNLQFTQQISNLNDAHILQNIDFAAKPVMPPSAPLNLIATPGDGQVTLTWDVPEDDGGSAITDYKIKWRLFHGKYAVFDDGISTDTSATVTGLENDKRYRLMIHAINNAGQERSKQVSTTPNEHGIEYTKPSVPQNISAIVGDGQVTLTWEAPLDNGGMPIKGYVIKYNDHIFNWKPITIDDGSLRTYTITDLENDQNHRFRIQALSEANIGFPSKQVLATPTQSLP